MVSCYCVKKFAILSHFSDTWKSSCYCVKFAIKTRWCPATTATATATATTATTTALRRIQNKGRVATWNSRYYMLDWVNFNTEFWWQWEARTAWQAGTWPCRHSSQTLLQLRWPIRGEEDSVNQWEASSPSPTVYSYTTPYNFLVSEFWDSVISTVIKLPHKRLVEVNIMEDNNQNSDKVDDPTL